MSRKCALTGKKSLVGNKRSHSNIKTKKVSRVNLHKKKVFNTKTGKTTKIKISTSAIRTLDKVGSLT